MSNNTNVKDLEIGTELVNIHFDTYGFRARIGRTWTVTKITKTRVVVESPERRPGVDGVTTKRLVVDNMGRITLEEGRKESRYYDDDFYILDGDVHQRAVLRNAQEDIKSAAKSAAEYFVGRANDPAALNTAIEKLLALQESYKERGIA